MVLLASLSVVIDFFFLRVLENADIEVNSLFRIPVEPQARSYGRHVVLYELITCGCLNGEEDVMRMGVRSPLSTRLELKEAKPIARDCPANSPRRSRANVTA